MTVGQSGFLFLLVVLYGVIVGPYIYDRIHAKDKPVQSTQEPVPKP
ncbi:MAG: hypothetical protein ACR2KS_04595 [Candidatus Eremiobacter antarcticus]|nr:hypothetical protein [Candidatus Eremiobacteraeota bacterium]MBC5807668.1 hypothetical protein [Candidatus Eremiobacteraeota bacterium]